MTRTVWTEESLAQMERLRDKYVALSVQVDFGRAEAVSQLLKAAGKDRKALLERTNTQGRTLLHEAVADNNLPMVRAVVSAGRMVDVQGAGGTPALVAAKNGQLDILKYLASKGANLNVREENTKYSMLLAAIWAKQHDVALYLIDQKVDFSEAVRSERGWSAIDFAATAEDPTVFFRLVEEGAAAACGLRPIEIPIRHHCVAVVKACMAHPEYCRPMLEEGYEKILEHCVFDEMRQLLLALRSQVLIESAMDTDGATAAPPSAAPRRSPGMAL